jgi:O-acetyl-ADP-ribose deacetylase (regulator of RNase III)
MEKQGYAEPTGKAKVTSAYNLPSEYVIHTVGPIVDGRLTEEHCTLLESCYRSCLEAACENGISSVAFCCISTGVFGFPKERAAEIAVKTVRDFRSKNKDTEVIFNVWGQEDFDIYRKLLG